MKAEIYKSVLIQVTGSALMFSCIGIIGYNYGAGVQGMFSLLRSEIELVAALGSFGLPQAIFYYIGKEMISKKGALLLVWFICVLVGAVAAIYYFCMPSNFNIVHISLVVLAVLNATHNALRYIVLAIGKSVHFNIISFIPSFVLLILTSLAVWNGGGDFEYLFYAMLCSYALSVIYSLCFFGLADGGSVGLFYVPLRSIFLYSLGPGLSIILWAITPVYIGRLLSFEVSTQALGHFTVLIMLQQLMVMPVNLASPLLFKMFLRSGLKSSESDLKPVLSIGALGLMVFAIWSQIYTVVKFPSNFSEYEDIIPFLGLMVISASFESVSRFEAVKAYSLKQQFIPSLADVFKLMVVVVGVNFMPALNLASSIYIWCVATVVSVAPYFFKKYLVNI